MRRSRLFPVLAMLGALVLLTTACGQKAGVNVASSGGAIDSEGNPVESGAVDAEGNPIGPGEVDAEGNPIAGGSGGGSGGGSTTRRGGSAGATATTVASGKTPTTKVWGCTVMLGIHAPITGAAPLPSTFQKAATEIKAYFNSKATLPPGPNCKTAQNPTGARQIDIHIVDDEYQPATATTRCRELVDQRNAFMLLGAAGTDQIQACARFAASVGVPYLSAGVTESGLTTLKNYFAVSMTYKAQGPYLANYMKQSWPDKATAANVWMVYADTPNFRDAVASFTTAFPGVKTKKVGRVPSVSELQTAAKEICDAGAKIAYPLMAPKDWLILIGAQGQSCRPQWAGIGVTMGVNEVAGTACSQPGTEGAFDGSRFFSPVPNIDVAADLDPELKAATKGPGTFDDIYVALWNAVKTTTDLLKRAGPDLNRAGFVKSTENATNVGGKANNSVGVALNFSPTDHFGADEVHVLEAECDKLRPSDGADYNKYKTVATYAKY